MGLISGHSISDLRQKSSIPVILLAMVTDKLEPIESFIVTVRNQRIILAADLAKIYGVQTRVLNQAVKRNIKKFPADFLFQLSRKEAEVLGRSRSQSVILKRGQNIKYLPYAFTEHGALMAANVLNSQRAVQMSVFVVRAFVQLRQIIVTHKDLEAKLNELERKFASHDEHIQTLFRAIRQLMAPQDKKQRRIGFIISEKAARYLRSSK